MSNRTIYWHDYETFGANPRRDRAAQFAGIRTDEDLNIIGDPLVVYCQPAPDMLPHPQSSLITGITPQKALAQGLCEADFIAAIHAELLQPGTCVAGYNSIRFDDELTRQLLYRNFHDPYEREWKNGNSRWDIIDMVRLCAAVRPEGINWPRKEDGTLAFKLDMLTVANGIAHADAHDALADVVATIELARLVRRQQPRLYQHIFQLRNKTAVQAQLDLRSHKPVLHVSAMYPAALGCLALVAPLCRHPVDNNGVIVCDLRMDPRQWLSLGVEELRARLFTPQSEMEEGQERIPLKVVHLNRCPVVVPANVLDTGRAAQYEIDLARSHTHWQQLSVDPQQLAAALKNVALAFDRRFITGEAAEEIQLEDDPDYMIYSGGFFAEADKRSMAAIRACKPDELGQRSFAFLDGRLHDMLFRYRARNWPASLNLEETQRWADFCRQRLQRQEQGRHAGLGLQAFRKELQTLRSEPLTAQNAATLNELESYTEALVEFLHL